MKFYVFLLFLFLMTISACGSNVKEQKLDDSFYKTIGSQIRKQRLMKGISQKALAEKVGLTQNSLSLIEDGLATPIHTKLIAIQDYLEVEFVINGRYSKIEDYLKEE